MMSYMTITPIMKGILNSGMVILAKEVVLTCCFISQLSADHLGVTGTPEVIAHCAPDIVVADLHTSTSGGASLESDGSLGACGTTHSNIFSMCAVGGSKCWNSAVSESGLIPMTVDI